MLPACLHTLVVRSLVSRLGVEAGDKRPRARWGMRLVVEEAERGVSGTLSLAKKLSMILVKGSILFWGRMRRKGQTQHGMASECCLVPPRAAVPPLAPWEVVLETVIRSGSVSLKAIGKAPHSAPATTTACPSNLNVTKPTYIGHAF